ncbi:hypothetical protein Hanom_Chr12g01171721 [Helianthus anomalus]
MKKFPVKSLIRFRSVSKQVCDIWMIRNPRGNHEKVDLPDGLQSRKNLDISKLKESVVVLEYYYALEQVCDIWMMRKNGVPKSSFTKLFSVNVVLHSIIGFRKNGQLILGGGGELKVYERGSEHMNSLGIYGWHFKVASYTESLLLLNHPAVTKTT